MPRPGLLIGSVPPQDELGVHYKVMQYFARQTTQPTKTGEGSLWLQGLPYYQDPSWSSRQLDRLTYCPGVAVVRAGDYPRVERYSAAPILRLKPRYNGDPIAGFKWGMLHDTRNALAAYADVTKEFGLTTPLQVGVNVVDILYLAFRTGAAKVLQSALRQVHHELREIYNLTKGNVVFMIESPLLTNFASIPARLAHSQVSWFIDAITSLVRGFPTGAKWGIHFCYGRVGGRALFDSGLIAQLFQTRRLYKLENLVGVSNTLLGSLRVAGFVPTFVHYPLVLGNEPPDFSKLPLRIFSQLVVPAQTRIYMGAVHPMMSVMTLERVYKQLDEAVLREPGSVGVSATCGWGSSTAQEMDTCLQLMRKVAYR